jgi:hypothetical protein
MLLNNIINVQSLNVFEILLKEEGYSKVEL